MFWQSWAREREWTPPSGGFGISQSTSDKFFPGICSTFFPCGNVYCLFLSTGIKKKCTCEHITKVRTFPVLAQDIRYYNQIIVQCLVVYQLINVNKLCKIQGVQRVHQLIYVHPVGELCPQPNVFRGR